MAAVWEVRLYDGSYILVEVAEGKDLARDLVKKKGGFWSPAPQVAVRHSWIVSVRPVGHAVQEAQFARAASEEASPKSKTRKPRPVIRGFGERP